jgi:pimeloyl-ACP methyl ester carboxylesterase
MQTAYRRSASSTAWRSTDGRRSKDASRGQRFPSRAFYRRQSSSRSCVATFGYGDPDRATRSLDLYLRPFAGTDGRDALVSHIRALTSDETRELGTQLARIAAPTAIVWGQQDRVIPLWVGRQLQQAIPGASLDIVPGGRHFTPEEAPRHVADAIAKLTAMTANSQ